MISLEVLGMCRKGVKELRCNVITVLNVSLLTLFQKKKQ